MAISAAGQSAGEPPIRVLRSLVAESTPAPASHSMYLTLAVLAGTGWDPEAVLEAARNAGTILAQCAILTETIEVLEVEVPPPYRSLYTPLSRELARRLKPARPAVFFVADTRHHPAFDAEAFGRGNSRMRPEMADTVWIAAGTRDLPVVIAHELAHVLADSGAHSEAPGNLMGEETAPGGTLLTRDQCDAIVARGTANGLLRPSPR